MRQGARAGRAQACAPTPSKLLLLNVQPQCKGAATGRLPLPLPLPHSGAPVATLQRHGDKPRAVITRLRGSGSCTHLQEPAELPSPPHHHHHHRTRGGHV